MAFCGNCRFSAESLGCQKKRVRFDAFAYLPQLKRFPRRVSGNPDHFYISRSKGDAEFRTLANRHFGIVGHFNRFAFLHQLKQFRNVVSMRAVALRMCDSDAFAEFRFSPKGYFHFACHFNRFAFLHQLKPSPISAS
jgi:hypothetical protein